MDHIANTHSATISNWALITEGVNLRRIPNKKALQKEGFRKTSEPGIPTEAGIPLAGQIRT